MQIKKLWKPLFNIAGIVSLGVAAASICSNSKDLSYEGILGHYIGIATVLSFFAFFSACRAWQIAINRVTQQFTSLRTAAVDIGYNLIYKYLPGKVWGIVTRYQSGRARHLPPERLILAITLEQAAYIFAITLYAIPSAILWSPKLLVGMPIYHAVIILLAICVIASAILYFSKREITQYAQSIVVNGRTLFAIFIWQAICLTLDSLALSMICLSMNVDITSLDILYLMSASCFSILLGMIAIFVPSGLGIREASFVMLTSSILGIDQAFVASVIFRILSTARDVVAGSYALRSKYMIR